MYCIEIVDQRPTSASPARITLYSGLYGGSLIYYFTAMEHSVESLSSHVSRSADFKLEKLKDSSSNVR